MTDLITKLIQAFQKPPERKTDIPKVRVDAVVAKLGSAYEKVRNAVDYKEENLIRVSAIERILLRKLSTNRPPMQMAQTLVEELIWAKYIANDSLPVDKVSDVANIIHKYVRLKQEAAKADKTVFSKNRRLVEWLYTMASHEIDELLFPTKKQRTLIDVLYRVVSTDMRYGYVLPEEDKKIQLYIACYRALFKVDAPMIEYVLLRYFYPQWFVAPDVDLMEMAKHLGMIYGNLRRVSSDPLSETLARKIKNHAVIFDIFREILEDKPEKAKEIFGKAELLESTIKSFATKKYAEAKKKLRRKIFRLIVYLFITKSLLAFAIEIPLDYILEKTVHYTSILINVLFPPIMMFVFALRIRVPSDKNTAKLVEYAKAIISGHPHEELFVYIMKPKKQNIVMRVLFWIFYLCLYIATFGALSYALTTYLEFNLVSIGFFVFFLCIVSFFLIRISRFARELNVLKRKDSILTFLFDLFLLPVLRIGRWLSTRLSQINVFIFILDVLIEAPYKTVLTFIEQWLGFIKEKKDEVY